MANEITVKGPRSWVRDIILGDGVNHSGTITLTLADGKGDCYFAGKSDAATYDFPNWQVDGGFILGIDDSIAGNPARFFIGDSGGNNLSYSSSTGILTVSGTIVATLGNIGGFYIGANDLWGGNAAIGHANTTIVLGNLDGVSKIALGPSADAITVAGVQTGFIIDGGGNLRVGDANSWLRWSGGALDVQLANGESLTVSAGGDIVMLTALANPSFIRWINPNHTVYLGFRHDADDFCWYPDIDGHVDVKFGTSTLGGPPLRFHDIQLFCSNKIYLRGGSNYIDSSNVLRIAGGIVSVGHILPSAANSYDVGTTAVAGKPWRTVYAHALSDQTCAYMGDYNIEQLYRMFAQIKPVKDGTLHHAMGTDKYYPHTDFASLPEEFAWREDAEGEVEMPAYNSNGKLIKKIRKYGKGDNSGIDRLVQIDALIALIVKMYEQNQELVQKVEVLENR